MSEIAYTHKHFVVSQPQRDGGQPTDQPFPLAFHRCPKGRYPYPLPASCISCLLTLYYSCCHIGLTLSLLYLPALMFLLGRRDRRDLADLWGALFLLSYGGRRCRSKCAPPRYPAPSAIPTTSHVQPVVRSCFHLLPFLVLDWCC